MHIAAALTGNLEKVMADVRDEAALAVTLGTTRTTDDLKNRLRQQVLAAFGSQRLANTWRGATYPKLPMTSMGAAGMVISKAPHIIESFDRASVIRSKDGFFLAIPSPDAPKGTQFKPITPSNFPEDRYGPLRFVYRPGKTSLLVVDGVRRTAAGRVGRQMARTKSGGFKRGAASVVMFFLVPYVRMKKVFDLNRDYDRALGDMVSNIIEAWK
jgi:hypothetical protein